MKMAQGLRRFLDGELIPYELLSHERTDTTNQSAAAAGIAGDQVAKAVVLDDQQRFLVAMIPATHRLELGVLHAKLGTQVAAENLGDWRRHVFLTGSPGDGRLLLRTNFEPAVGILGLPIGLVRLRFVVGLVLNNANTFVEKTFQEEAKELFGILLVSASHTLETGESADRIVDVLWRNRLAILLKLLLTECFLDLL